jgi:hypothetical protein
LAALLTSTEQNCPEGESSSLQGLDLTSLTVPCGIKGLDLSLSFPHGGLSPGNPKIHKQKTLEIQGFLQ